MSKTVKLRDEDYQDQSYTVQNGVKIPLADGSGMATAYFVEGTLSIAANGSYDVTDKASVAVHVPTGGGGVSLADLIGGYTPDLSITAADLAGITQVNEYAFYGKQLFSLTLPEGVTFIGSFAFSHFSTDSGALDLPNSVTHIWSGAFYQSDLTSLSIGTGIQEIAVDAFAESMLETLTILATTPPLLGENAFTDSSISFIYVPSTSVSAYQTAPRWSQYASIIQAIPTT